jgi:hypothetical protein
MVYTPPPSPSMSRSTQIANPATSLQLYSQQPGSELMTFGNQNDFYAFQFPSHVHSPFSWMSNLDWKLLRNLASDTKALIKLPDFSLFEYKEFFYKSHQMTTVCSTSDTGILCAQYLVTLLMNDMQPSSQTNLDNIHEWLRSIPQAAVLQFFKDLPTGHSDVLRERVYAAAMSAGDEKIVRLMLELGLDLGQAIEVWSYKGRIHKLPLCTALILGHYSIAKVMVAQLCSLGPRTTSTIYLTKF